MSKITITLLLTIFLTASLVFSQGFNSVHTKNGVNIWAAGNSGLVFYSADAGLMWSSMNVGSSTFNAVFATTNRVYLAGVSGAFYYSTTHGSSWNYISAGSQTINSIYFLDDNNGWMVGNAGTILRTSNGGLNWTTQTSPVSDNLNSIKLSSTTSGYACGANGKVILWNGSAWSTSSTSTTKDLLSISRVNNTIIATSADGFIIKSTNNGSSWNTIDYKIETKSNVNSVMMMDENTFYTCGGGGFIRKTTNGGNTSMFLENPMMGNLVSIYFYGPNNGWAVSSKNNAIIRTTDAGGTWSLPQGTTVNYSWTLKQSGSSNIGHGFCLHPFNKNAIFIAMGNRVYRSYDRGETWNQFSTISPGSRAHTFFVSKTDTNYMIASMDESSGRVLRSTNYGTTWTVTWGPGALTSYGMPMMADQNTPELVYLNPDNSLLLKSTNWGLNWSSVGTQVFRSPDNITVAWENPNVIFSGDGVTGSGQAELFKTTNGGLNWSLIHTVSGSEIPFTVVSSLDVNLTYHSCWSSGGIWKSGNLWSSFTQVASSGNAWAVDIAKDDPTAVAYGLYASTVYHSTNSGVTFTSTSTGSSPEAGMLFYDKGTLLSQKGGGVYKLNISYTVPTVTSIGFVSSEIPDNYSLSQNYPNPFNPVTKIKFAITGRKGSLQNVTINVFDILGKQIKTLVNRQLAPGIYETEFDGSEITSGVYFYRITAEDFTETRKMILNK